MLLSKAELEKLAEKYQKKADHAIEKYQETGISRYYREYRDNGDLADAMTIAASAADDHHKLIAIESQIRFEAARAECALQDNADREVLVGILNDHISYAASVCGYTRKARIPEKGGA